MRDGDIDSVSKKLCLCFVLRARVGTTSPGLVDPFSLHAGCPPQGQAAKWACNQWVWNTDLDEDWTESVEQLQQQINSKGYT